MPDLEKMKKASRLHWGAHRELILFFAALVVLFGLVIGVYVAIRGKRGDVPALRSFSSTSEKFAAGDFNAESTDSLGLEVKTIDSEMTLIEKQAIYQHAQKLYQLGATSLAAEQYGMLIKYFTDDARLLNDYGNALRDLGKFDEAKTMYSAAMELDAHLLPAYVNLASMLIDVKAYDDAAAVIEDGQKANADSEAYTSAVEPLRELIIHYASTENVE